MLGLAAACAAAIAVNSLRPAAVLNVLVTLRDHALMANVTEWNPVSVLPLASAAAVSRGVASASLGRCFSAKAAALPTFWPPPRCWSTPCFTPGTSRCLRSAGMVIASVHLPSAIERLRLAVGFTGRSPLLRPLLGVFAVLIVMTTALVSLVSLQPGDRAARMDFGRHRRSGGAGPALSVESRRRLCKPSSSRRTCAC